MNKNTRPDPARSDFPSFRRSSSGFFVSGFAVASVVSAGLFWVMFHLISTVQDVIPVEKPRHFLPFIDLNRDLEEPPKRKPKPKRPPVVDLPMPAAAPDWGKGGGVPAFKFSPPDSLDPGGNSGHGKIGIGEREYMPLTEIQPNYPEKALIRGVEGTCVVLYTITKTGSVADVRVDESRCTSSYFHSPSMRAAAKFKYAPRIVDGETREARNVVKLIRFSITE